MSSRTPANGGTPASGNNGGSSNDSRQRQLASPVATTPSSSNGADLDEYARNPNPEMAYYHSFLSKLLNLISNGGEQAVARVISVIRSGATHSEILDVIDQVSEGSSSRSNGDSNSGSQGHSA